MKDIMETLQKVVDELIQSHPNQRTFNFEYEGKKLWVKQPEMGEANIWHFVLAFLSKFINNHFLKPTVVTDPVASLEYEAKKLTVLKEHRISVPTLYLATKSYIVLEDAGKPLSSLLNDNDISLDIKMVICKQLGYELALMHNKGFYHSRPALRDITYHEGKIYFMDFEENLEGILSKEEAILRDGFIFIHALYRKLHTPELIATALESYHRTLNPECWDRLMDDGRSYNIMFYFLLSLKRYLGKDALAIYHTLAYFRS